MGGSFCPCQSVAADPRLFKEWHPDNPPAAEVVKASDKVKYLWLCPEGHAPYEASCLSRRNHNTGCPACGDARKGKRFHPSLSEGRQDPADEWVVAKNDKSPEEITLGSHYPVWWRCSSNSEHPPWQAPVYSRALEGKGCPECRHRSSPRKFGSM